MKKVVENRYPHSATLFKFCREALEIRFNGNVKVIDQDVGAILGYDPADCSHWKKGKKNIRALATLRSIADHLNIDERLLIDVASGRVGLEEAVFEYKGYGSFSLHGRNLDTLKKEYFRNPRRYQEENTPGSFDELFDVNRAAVAKLAHTILDAGRFEEAPIYLPELCQRVPSLQLIHSEEIDQAVIVDTSSPTETIIKHRGPDTRPYVRFMIAREIFAHLVRVKHSWAERFFYSPTEVFSIQSNLFAGLLLVPANLLRREVDRVDTSRDLVAQLAQVFWVSNSMMNQRLRDYMEHAG